MTHRRLYAGSDLSRAVTIDDLRQMARKRLPRFLFEYVDGGAEDELTLRRNRDAFARHTLQPSTLVDVSNRTQAVELLGRPAAAPLVIAPTGFNGMLSQRADVALARAAAKASVPFTLSMAANVRLEDVATDAGGRLWMQLYWVRDRDFIRSLVTRAEKAGFEALVLTSDVQVSGGREWDRRNYRAGMQLSLRNKLDVLAHPRWLWHMLREGGPPRFANIRELAPPDARTVIDDMMTLGRNMDPACNWDDLRWLRSIWPRRLLVKGILSVPDAERAIAHGADGVILSNHGGRQLDGAISALETLPAVRHALGPDATILVDGGIRRGVDVIKAKALGATAVMTGRNCLYGVAVAGEAGALRALDIIRQETDRAQALLGVPDINALDERVLSGRTPIGFAPLRRELSQGVT
ncbi:FMN-dependent dehydrogenase [Pandoraea terrae]|uniref:FMN-dependent dehydrogenase n=1 Tax=Pandoraea terrae TaxID=1537710 RepID=A0A5E4WK40_9BURK|nr:alpha-hydroxy acid oxidase [Pandoraea terrae]VVE23416.1 FMN-dependent dehydrogenase [Pandoraea terrae]